RPGTSLAARGLHQQRAVHLSGGAVRAVLPARADVPVRRAAGVRVPVAVAHSPLRSASGRQHGLPRRLADPSRAGDADQADGAAAADTRRGRVLAVILEGVVTTLSADGALNVAPMGPHLSPPYRIDVGVRFELKPYQTSKTYANLTAHPEGVLHVHDDVLLLA